MKKFILLFLLLAAFLVYCIHAQLKVTLIVGTEAAELILFFIIAFMILARVPENENEKAEHTREVQQTKMIRMARNNA